ncbi:MAG: cobalamin biosynthesis protein [Steroidobacteraceae bacterium]
MALGEAMIVAGIGCRSGVDAAEVEAALAAALLEHRATPSQLGLIAIPGSKAQESGIVAAAAARNIPIALIAQQAMEAVSEFAITRSSRAMAVMNVNSVAETAALAGAGSNARLLGPRVAVGPVTCALAEGAIPV